MSLFFKFLGGALIALGAFLAVWGTGPFWFVSPPVPTYAYPLGVFSTLLGLVGAAFGVLIIKEEL